MAFQRIRDNAIADDSLGTDKIKNLSITNADVAADANIDESKLNLTNLRNEIAAGGGGSTTPSDIQNRMWIGWW